MPIEKNVIRDSSNAIVSKDTIALEEYKKTKQKNRLINSMSERLNILEERVAKLEKLLG